MLVPMLRSGFLASLAVAALGTSCALKFTDYPAEPDSSGTGAAAASTTKSASVGSLSSGSASSSTGSGPSKLGVVIASQNKSASYGEADFGKDATAFPPSCLELIPVGTCEKYACTGSNATASAGVITIKSSSGNIAISPDVNGDYAQQPSGASLWQPGEIVTIHASGAEVPTFQLMVPGPAVPTITSPGTTALVIDRSSGLNVQWSGPLSAQIYVFLGSSGASPTAVECVFDGAAGMGFIPPSVLTDFQAQESASLAIASLSQSTIVAGDWSVTGKLQTVAYNSACTFQ